MSLIARFAGRLRLKHFGRDESGIAAVEFGLLSTALFTLMAGAIDITNAYIVQRDVARVSVEVSQSLSTCQSSDCVLKMMGDLNSRKINVMLGFSSADLGMAEITRKDDAILVLQGPMTYLPADVNATALKTLANGDVGIAALITYTHKPFIVGFAEKWGMNVVNMRSFAVTLRAKNVKMV